MSKRSENKVIDYTLLTFGVINSVHLLNKQYNFLSNDRKAMVSFKLCESDMGENFFSLSMTRWLDRKN